MVDALGQFVTFTAWCPEVGIGLGVPRPTIQLTGSPDAPRVTGVADASLDVTDAIRDYSDHVHLETGPSCGYVFKHGSPSCAITPINVVGENGNPVGSARGGYAARLMALDPLMPCEDEDRLRDPRVRESFVERVFLLERWYRLRAQGLSSGTLVAFHTTHKYPILSHSEVEYRRLGPMIAGAGGEELGTSADEYIRLVMRAMSQPSTVQRHTNVLQHLLGFLRGAVDVSQRKTLADAVENYRLGKTPLAVPVTLFREQFERQPHGFASAQYYSAALSRWPGLAGPALTAWQSSSILCRIVSGRMRRHEPSNDPAHNERAKHENDRHYGNHRHTT